MIARSCERRRYGSQRPSPARWRSSLTRRSKSSYVFAPAPAAGRAAGTSCTSTTGSRWGHAHSRTDVDSFWDPWPPFLIACNWTLESTCLWPLGSLARTRKCALASGAPGDGRREGGKPLLLVACFRSLSGRFVDERVNTLTAGCGQLGWLRGSRVLRFRDASAQLTRPSFFCVPPCVSGAPNVVVASSMGSAHVVEWLGC